MKTIGLLGGMSWESTKYYYEILNEQVKEKLGGLHSAKCLLYSFDFQGIKTLQHEGKWAEATMLLIEAAKNLEAAGADFIVLCTNTMHISAEAIQDNIRIPFLHIADATAERIKKDQKRRIGLLGTRFTMAEDFYKGRLELHHGIEVIVPDEEEMDSIHKIIYEELCLGIVTDESREEYIRIINNLVKRGAEGVILGCTEITLLIKQDDVTIPVYDTTEIHAVDAVEKAIG